MRASTIVKGAIARFGIRPYPMTVDYELTWRCNLECVYCDRHTPMARELTREQIFAALGEFHALGMRQTHLDGGDPLTHRHVDEIVDWLTARDVGVSMNTNGILVPRKRETIRKLSRVTISLDGPRESHDAFRGRGSFDKALAGAEAARGVGVPVAFTCTVGRHNEHAIGEALAIAEGLGASIVFQPATNSLFLETDRDGSAWQLETAAMRAVFARIEAYKRAGRAVGNRWSSLRHFRRFPEDVAPPCAAGWVAVTMDPEGMLFPCGQLNRSQRTNSVVELGVARAFANLARTGCSQCWCARLVEDNYVWGLRLDKMLPPLRTPSS
ncbi:MAG TPA: radical SAM protein [Myxococcota bacterium]|nr:radical SAM protein [Myxococcota bacterium]